MMQRRLWTSYAAAVALTVAVMGCGGDAAHPAAAGAAPSSDGGETRVATFAGGCFWCVESAFDDLPGVVEAVSGYTGGREKDPTYEQVSAGATGHYEAVQVRYVASVVDYETLLDTFWRQTDPTDAGGQFADRGAQYRTAIFAHDEGQRQIAEASRRFLEESGWFDEPIATPVLPAGPFYRAEEYHQDYHRKNPAHYEAYRHGSGRGPFIERFWKDKPPIRPARQVGEENEEGAKVYRKPDDEELRRRLTPMQYEVTQHEGTEPPFMNEYWDHHEPGIYVDIVSGEPLFASTDKFDSGTGWPSFTKPIDPGSIVEKTDSSLGMTRTEIRSRHGDSHLGHLFPDGPPPTGMRYCMNSAALRFVPASRLEQEGYGRYARMFRDEASP